MKKVFTVIMLLMVGLATSQVRAGNDPAPSKVKFEQVIYDFGEMEYGSDVSHVFKFKNTSKEPVIIKNVGTSCGCTTPGWTKEPVMPGKSGNVTAKYDSSRIGAFTKTLTVDLDGEVVVLTIKGIVKEPKK